MYKQFVLLLCLSVSMASTWSQTSEPVNLDEGTLTSLIKGKTLATENTRWGNVQLQFQDSGSLYGSNARGSDSGKWRVEGSKLCLEWGKWEYEGCGLVQKVGDKYQHLWPNGNVHFLFSP